MSDKERDSAARRKRAADPNQPQKSGAAKPTNVSTDPKKKMKESFVNEAKDRKVRVVVQKMPVIIRSSQDTPYGQVHMHLVL